MVRRYGEFLAIFASCKGHTMCGSMVDIQSVTAKIKRGKKIERLAIVMGMSSRSLIKSHAAEDKMIYISGKGRKPLM